jgi:hypothetical protein
MSRAVAVSDALYARLEHTAHARGVTIEQLLTELSQALPPPGQATMLDALRRGGLAPVAPEAFADLIDPTADYDAIRQALAQKCFASSLSDTILAERG